MRRGREPGRRSTSPLNDRLWLKERFAEIRAKDDEKERLAGIQAILDWTNPGPGGFYDDLGRTTAQPHLVPGKSYEDDPQYFESPQMAFTCRPGYRLSWCDFADGLYGYEVKLHYPRLDPDAEYRLRVIFSGSLGGEDRPNIVRLTGDGQEISEMPKPRPDCSGRDRHPGRADPRRRADRRLHGRRRAWRPRAGLPDRRGLADEEVSPPPGIGS